MKKDFICVIITVVLFLSVADLGFTDNTSASFPVSCSIPLMPGLNAPLIEKNELKPQTDAMVEQKAEVKKEDKENPQELIQEDDYAVMVKTFYSR